MTKTNCQLLQKLIQQKNKFKAEPRSLKNEVGSGAWEEKASPVEWSHLPCDHCQDHAKNRRNRSQFGLILQKRIENYQYNIIVISSIKISKEIKISKKKKLH